MASIEDPEAYAVLLVQQFLKERGFDRALRETESAIGLRYVADKLPRGSMLLELVYDSMERAAGEDNSDLAEQLREEEDLLQGGRGDFPEASLRTITGLHKATITSICHCPGDTSFVTGSGDGTIQSITHEGEEMWATRVGHGGAIALALHPEYRAGDARLLVGSMDGTVSLIDTAAGNTLCGYKAHAKYVVCVRWAPCGRRFLSGSWDGSVCAFEVTGTNSESGSGELRLLARVPFPTAVQDVAFLPGGDRHAVALRDTSSLRIRRFPQVEEAEESVNLNASGDHHVSFSARQLAVSASGRFLLASTDGPRIVLLRIQGWKHLRCQIFGLPVENFHSPIALWHASDFYIMAGAAAGRVVVFHVGSGKVVAELKAHEKNVRALAYDAERNLLLTCSFDRTVRVFGRLPSGPSEPPPRRGGTSWP